MVRFAARRTGMLLMTFIVTAWSCCYAVAVTEGSEGAVDVFAAASVEALARNPESFLGKPVEVSGWLRNIGDNYFTDLRLALTDEQGNFVYVTPWLPIALPTLPRGYSGERPPVLSDYIDHKVELVGTLEQSRFKNVGDVYALRVRSAQKLNPQ